MLSGLSLFCSASFPAEGISNRRKGDGTSMSYTKSHSYESYVLYRFYYVLLLFVFFEHVYWSLVYPQKMKPSTAGESPENLQFQFLGSLGPRLFFGTLDTLCLGSGLTMVLHGFTIAILQPLTSPLSGWSKMDRKWLETGTVEQCRGTYVECQNMSKRSRGGLL